MFEFSIAKKYLVPKRKQLSIALISLMSVTVISLVVWLVLVFISVTNGIEKNWLQKLTTLNGPIRITPTPAYFSSYYYQIDNYSSATNYSPRSLAQKANAEISDPYDAASDMELPAYFPNPEYTTDGKLIDPVQQAVAILKKRGLTFQEYEVGGAMLRLHLIRSGNTIPNPSANLTGNSLGREKQSFLTQVAYITSLSDRNPHLPELLIPPSAEDIQNLFQISAYDLPSSESENGTPLTAVSENNLRERVIALLNTFSVQQLETGETRWAIPRSLFPEQLSCCAHAYFQGDRLLAIRISKDANASSPPTAVQASLTRDHSHWTLKTKDERTFIINDDVPFLTDGNVTFQASLVPSSLQRLRTLGDVTFAVEGSLQNVPLKGHVAWQGLKIASAHPYQDSPYALFNTSILGVKAAGSPVILPKQFQEGGVRCGDRGFLNYAANTASSVQEQRLPIVVSGFYDPGLMAIGNKCILAPPDLVHSVNASNQSFQLDPLFANGIQVWVRSLSDAKSIKKELQTAFEDAGIGHYWNVTTYHDYDFAKDLLLQFQSDKYMFTLVGGIILVVACCNIISLLVLLVNDKKREIGILQAMGAKTSSIACIFAACGAGMGIISSLLGTLAAVFTLRHIDSLAYLLSLIQGHDAFNAMFYGKSLPNSLSSEALLFCPDCHTPSFSFSRFNPCS